jgi:hypothetical protein
MAMGIYKDEDVWPVRCARCDHGFTAKIGQLKFGLITKCVGCSHDLGYSTEEFLVALSEARKGKHNPWWEMLRSISQPLPSPDRTHAGQTQDPQDFDLVEQAFNLFLFMDAKQRASLIARQQDRMAREPPLNQPRRRSD